VTTDARSADSDYVRAILNILEDFSSEKERFAETQRAILNILDDFAAEQQRLKSTERAVMNILDDFDEEKQKVERANGDLLREIADRTRAEEELQSKTIELGRSNAELEQFAYVASHDLQEPLRMVSTYVELFEKRFKGSVDDPKADKYIAYAVEGAKRMQALIAGLLAYSRVGARDHVTPRVNIDDLVDVALLNLSEGLLETSAVVTREPLPTIMVEALQLTQVFQNLIANANKFRRPDIKPHIHISAVREGANWIFSVTDNGIGIEPEFFDRIFVIFQRLHTRAEFAGTGIGLSICKKVVERHGGRIWIESVPGQGTSFCFSLPAMTGVS
jgi:light-regulated signal transduction histidine kinase (bacteriophytochrome)